MRLAETHTPVGLYIRRLWRAHRILPILIAAQYVPQVVQAEESDTSCATEESAALTFPIVPASGVMRGLFVFARFKDDNRVDWTEEWPVDSLATRRDALPTWAESLVEDVAPPSLPAIESSLTHYFHTMSRGTLRFNGRIYDSTIVLSKSIDEYAHQYTGLTRIHIAQSDVLDSLIAAGFDFGPFVNVHPGTAGADTLDYFCVLFRGAHHFYTCAASSTLSIGASGETGYSNLTRGTVCAPSWLKSWAVGSGSRVPPGDYPSQAGTISCGGCTTCPVNNVSRLAFVRTIAHEVGHSLYRNSTFLGFANHNWDVGNYDIMYSNGSGFAMHGFPRVLLGWVDPLVVSEGEEAHVTLYDSVMEGAPSFTSARTDSTICKIIPDEEDPTQYFILENRRGSSPYTGTIDLSSSLEYNGSPSTGLIITHVNTQGATTASWSGNCPPWSLKSHYLFIEPASGIWNSTFDPDPEGGRSRMTADYRGLNRGHPDDAWKASTCNAFTPYSCPNTNLFDGTDSLQTVPTGLSVLNISEGPDSSMSFDIKWDQPSNATAGSVAWSGTMLLSNDFTISAGDTLKLGPDAKVLARGGGGLAATGVDAKRVEIDVQPAGVLKMTDLVDPIFLASSRDTSLRIGPKPGEGIKFRKMAFVYPNCTIDSATVVSAPAPTVADWYGARIRELSSLNVSGASWIRNARTAIAYEKARFPSSLTSWVGANAVQFDDDLVHLGFDRDVVVPADSGVVIPVGWTVGFAANRDMANLGTNANLSELIVWGGIDFNGEDYYNRVVFMSDEADSAESYRKGDWGGMTLKAYGSCGSGRELDFTLFRDAVHGIAVQDTCLMEMNWPLFANNLSSDIYLDRDVRVPDDRRIDIRAPTRFVATAGASAYDHLGGEDDLVDLFVYGDFVTRRPDVVSPSDWVVFESTAKDSANGDDYGGIIVAETGLGHIEDADLGFAKRPVYFADADSAAVLESKVHHYSEEGILDWASDARIEGNVISVGAASTPEDTTRTGIHVVSSAASILGNAIGQHPDYGIWSEGSESFCMQDGISQTPSRTLRVERNSLTGAGEGNIGAGSAGIYLEWLCQYNAGVVAADTVSQWSGRGIHLHQCADVDLSCNRFINNRVGMRYFRNYAKLDTTIEGSAWFSQNEFKQSATNNVTVDDVVGLKLYDRGGSGALAEKNSFQKDSGSAWNFHLSFIHDADLDAGGSSWLNAAGAVLTDSVTIMATINKGIGDVLLSTIRTSEDLCDGSEAHFVHGPDERDGSKAGQGEVASLQASEGAIPARWNLSAPRPNPTAGGIEVDLDVPNSSDRNVCVGIFDVAGRRVATLYEGSVTPGRYRLAWDGRDGLGRATSPGIYFLHLKSADLTQSRKLLVLK